MKMRSLTVNIGTKIAATLGCHDLNWDKKPLQPKIVAHSNILNYVVLLYLTVLICINGPIFTLWHIFVRIIHQHGKSEWFNSCDRPSNLTQIGFKSSIFQPVWPWLSLVNSCIYCACQTSGIYQVLPYSVDFKAPGELSNQKDST